MRDEIISEEAVFQIIKFLDKDRDRVMMLDVYWGILKHEVFIGAFPFTFEKREDVTIVGKFSHGDTLLKVTRLYMCYPKVKEIILSNCRKLDFRSFYDN